MNGLTPLDHASMKKLQDLGGAEFLQKILGIFLQHAPLKIEEACAAMKAGNLPGVAAAAHPLKSGAGHVGACRVHELAASIERLANEGRSETLNALLRELAEAYAQVKPMLEACSAAAGSETVKPA
jgi:HPt (histidine-containing phosphotransfer) domain-containing protein